MTRKLELKKIASKKMKSFFGGAGSLQHTSITFPFNAVGSIHTQDVYIDANGDNKFNEGETIVSMVVAEAR